MVGVAGGLVNVVENGDGRLAALANEFWDKLYNIELVGEVGIGCRLVEQQMESEVRILS